MMAQYTRSKNVPMAEVAVRATGAALIVGGASIILGVKPKVGALALLGFLAGVSPIMHNFWDMEDSNERMNHMINFSKNLALAGAALALMGVEEPWDASVPVGQPSKLQQVRRFARKCVA